MDTNILKEKLTKISQQFLSRGKQESIDLYLCLLETIQEEFKDVHNLSKTFFIGYTGSKIEISEQSSPHLISKWAETNKTEMNIVVGPWSFDPESNKFDYSDNLSFFLESWHGYIIGELNPFLIVDDQLRYPYRKVS